MKARVRTAVVAALLGVAAGTLGGGGFEDAKLLASDGEGSDQFGDGVSIRGGRLVVGAWGDDDAAGSAGAAYVFDQKTDGSWQEAGKLTAGDPNVAMHFGRRAVSVFRDHVAVGARFADPAMAGAVYVFRRRPAGDWAQVAKLGPGTPGGRLGESVALDGRRLVAGAPFDGNGVVHVYERQAGGQWFQTATLSTPAGSSGTAFGDELAIHGRAIVVGAPAFGAFGPSSGTVFVFELQPGGQWAPVATLNASDAATGDAFGFSVSVSGDVLIAASPFDDEFGNGSGAVYVFERQGGVWTETAKLLATNGSAGDEFGYSAAISGSTVVVGARNSDTFGAGHGAAYVFKRQPDGTWVQSAELEASDGSANDAFGFSVAVSQGQALIGVPNNDDAGSSTGSAYVFDVGP